MFGLLNAQPFLKDLDTLNLRVCFLFQGVTVRKRLFRGRHGAPSLCRLGNSREMKGRCWTVQARPDRRLPPGRGGWELASQCLHLGWSAARAGPSAASWSVRPASPVGEAHPPWPTCGSALTLLPSVLLSTGNQAFSIYGKLES